MLPLHVCFRNRLLSTVILIMYIRRADKSVAEEIRARSVGDRRAVNTAAVDVGPFGHDVLHRERRIFSGRRGDRGSDTASRCYGTRGLSARRGVEGRHRRQSKKRVPLDTQLQNPSG